LTFVVHRVSRDQRLYQISENSPTIVGPRAALTKYIPVFNLFVY